MPAPTVESQPNGITPFRLLAVGQFVLVAVTLPLWTSQTDFPQVPLISFGGMLPRSFERGLLAIVLMSLSVVFFAQRLTFRRYASLTVGLSTLTLICIDQHRLQPWACQFIILSIVLALADASSARVLWQWLVIGIYAWSAWAKLDYGFCVQHGPFLLDGLCHAIGFSSGTRNWPEVVRLVVAGAIPVFELSVAVGLCWRRTRRFALFGSTLMHIGLLLALGPLGHRHQPGVLVWNVFFLVQNWLLFYRDTRGEELRHMECACYFGNALSWFVVFAALVWPILEPFGLCDHWLAWAVYAAKPERVIVFVDESELSKLPENMQRYLGSQTVLDEWYPVRIDRWSLDSLHVPIYPQDRFQVGVALGLVRRFQLTQIRIVVEGPANRWSGSRVVKEYVGMEAVEKLAGSYRLGAQPR